MNIKISRRVLVFIVILIPLLSSCSISVDTALTEMAVDQFHDSYNTSSFKTIYANSSPEFQDFVTEAKFTRLLQKLHDGLGQHKSSELTTWSAKSSIRDGTIVTLVYKAVYQYDDNAKESFTFKVNDGLARLYNFNVSSKILSKSTAI